MGGAISNAAASWRELTLFHIFIRSAIGCAIVARRAKEMNMIGHENVMTNPPAIAFCRSFPQTAQNHVAFGAA